MKSENTVQTTDEIKELQTTVHTADEIKELKSRVNGQAEEWFWNP